MSPTVGEQSGARGDWHVALRRARENAGLSRPALAALSGVSGHTIKAYELGMRNPSRGLLIALLDALGLDRLERTPILELAGFASDAAALAPARAGYWYTLDEAVEAVRRRRWPAHILSEMMEVLAANDIMLRVWGITRDALEAGDNRNLMASATSPQFASRIRNWDELMATGLAVMKGHHRGAQVTPEGSNPQFAALMKKFMSGDPRLVARAFELFERVKPQFPKIRYSYRVVWDHPGVGILRFEALVTTANDLDGFTFQDYVPVDAETWERLETLRDASLS